MRRIVGLKKEEKCAMMVLRVCVVAVWVKMERVCFDIPVEH